MACLSKGEQLEFMIFFELVAIPVELFHIYSHSYRGGDWESKVYSLQLQVCGVDVCWQWSANANMLCFAAWWKSSSMNWARLSMVFLIIAFSLWLSLETTGHPSSRSKFSDSWALGHYVRWTRLGHYVGIEVWINKRPIKSTTLGPFFYRFDTRFSSVGFEELNKRLPCPGKVLWACPWYISFFSGAPSVNIEMKDWKDDLFLWAVFQLFGLPLVFDLNLLPWNLRCMGSW